MTIRINIQHNTTYQTYCATNFGAGIQTNLLLEVSAFILANSSSATSSCTVVVKCLQNLSFVWNLQQNYIPNLFSFSRSGLAYAFFFNSNTCITYNRSCLTIFHTIHKLLVYIFARCNGVSLRAHESQDMCRIGLHIHSI